MRWLVLLMAVAACDPFSQEERPLDAGACAAPAIFARSCFGGCHEAATKQSGLDLESPGLESRAYNHPAAGRRDYLMIDPELPEESALIVKVRSAPPFGLQMPLGRAPLTAAEVGCLQTWVNTVVAGGLPDASTGLKDAGSDAGLSDAGVVAGFDAGRFWGPSVDAAECVPDGGRWCIVKHVPEPLYAVRGLSATNVWAVGSRGAAYHFDGTTWSRSDAGTGATLFDVFPLSVNDVWAVGERGLVLRNQGSGWREVGWVPNAAYPDAGLSTSGQPRWDLGGVSATASAVWVVGGGGTIAHFAAGTMQVVQTTNPNAPGTDFFKVMNRDDGEWWAGGGATMMYDGGSAGWLPSRGSVFVLFSIAAAANPTTHEPILVGAGTGFGSNEGGILQYSYTDPSTYPWQPPGFVPSKYDLNRDLRGIWLDPGAHGWTVGLDGELVELDIVPRRYARHVSPTHDHLLGVWGTSVSSTWAVGGRSEGVILRSR